MSGTLSVPGGSGRPGPRAVGASHDDAGAVSVEVAFGIIGLVLVALCLAWCLTLVGGEIALSAASRAAARVAARGETLDAVVREAHGLVPDADVTVRTIDGHAVVECSRAVSPPGVLARLGAVQLRARSAAVVEQP